MSRDLKFDNLRGLSIILIVLGHFIGSTAYMKTFSFDFTYTLIYLFDLPLLIFISGYFSKDTPESSIKAFRTVLIPYIIFNTFWIIFIFLKNGFLLSDIYLIPGFGLWYLLSLYFWRAFLPTAVRIKYIFWISLVLALIIGMVNIDDGFLSICRTICYFPIFLFGFYFKDIHEAFTIRRNTALCLLVPILLIGTLYFLPFNSTVLILKYAYTTLQLGTLKGMGLRLLFILISMMVIVLLYNIMTSKKTILTKVGQNSLPVYVLQFYFVFTLPDILGYLGLGYIFESQILSIIYVIAATISVSYILSRDKVRKGMDIIIATVIKLVMKENESKLDLIVQKIFKARLKIEKSALKKDILKRFD